MSKVVVIHGAGHEYWGPRQLLAKWRPAIRDGLSHHGVDVRDDEIGACFYGDLFRPTAQQADSDEWAASQDHVEELVRAAVPADDEHVVQSMSHVIGAAAVRSVRTMGAAFLSEPGLRDRLHRRLLDALDDDTELLVAHSFGTVVAVDALTQHTDVDLGHLVTIGCPLGWMSELTGDAGAWPPSVGSWTDIWSPTDPVASKRIADHYGDRVTEVEVYTGPNRHAPVPYLNASATGEVIAQALGLHPTPRSCPRASPNVVSSNRVR